MRKVIKIAELVSGMVLDRCVTDFNGKIVLSEGMVITDNIIHRLHIWGIDVCSACTASEKGDEN